jgi:hypothetical protein
MRFDLSNLLTSDINLSKFPSNICELDCTYQHCFNIDVADQLIRTPASSKALVDKCWIPLNRFVFPLWPNIVAPAMEGSVICSIRSGRFGCNSKTSIG